MNSSMDDNAKWPAKRDKTHDPIRGRDRGRGLDCGAQPFPLRFTPYVSRLAAPEHQSEGGFTPLSPRNCTIPAPFLHRFSILLFITHYPSTTCKSRSEKRCNSLLTLPAAPPCPPSSRVHASRITHHVSRITFHASRFTHHVSRQCHRRIGHFLYIFPFTFKKHTPPTVATQPLTQNARQNCAIPS
jgi:hypothetical protein